MTREEDLVLHCSRYHEIIKTSIALSILCLVGANQRIGVQLRTEALSKTLVGRLKTLQETKEQQRLPTSSRHRWSIIYTIMHPQRMLFMLQAIYGTDYFVTQKRITDVEIVKIDILCKCYRLAFTACLMLSRAHCYNAQPCCMDYRSVVPSLKKRRGCSWHNSWVQGVSRNCQNFVLSSFCG